MPTPDHKPSTIIGRFFIDRVDEAWRVIEEVRPGLYLCEFHTDPVKEGLEFTRSLALFDADYFTSMDPFPTFAFRLQDAR